MPQTYRASVIGAGMAGHLTLDALKASPRFTSVAVSDVNAAALAKIATEYPDVRTFPSPEAMFAASPADVVCIATYAPSHLPLTLAALAQKPRGLSVEKPLADITAAARQIEQAVKAAGVPVAVPHGLLVAPHSVDLIRRVRAGEIGQLRSVEFQNSGWDLINAGIHWFNFFVALTDREPLQWVLCACDTSTRTYRDGMQVETMAVTYAVTRSGVRLILNSGDHVPVATPDSGFLCHILGTEGHIEFYGWKNEYRLVNAAHPKGTIIQVENGGITNHRRHFESLAAQMDAAKPDYAVLESSLMALEICEAAYASHRCHRQIMLPLTGAETPDCGVWDPGRPYAGTGGGRDGRKL